MKSRSYTEQEIYFIDNLDRAIKEEWIKAYHHPLVRAASGHISDEESLARWEDPVKGTFAAAEFIPVLDREKLTYKLDLYMVERVLKKLKGQAEHTLHMVPESVNLSRSDFECCDMVKEITKRIDDSGLSRDKLCVELSEKDISSDIDFFSRQVERFRSEGISVWLDGYGSGHSSLLNLLKIRFDLLKIDKLLIDQIGKNDSGQIILTELIKTAMALGMDTSAEGVETKEQKEFLEEVGCTKLQGFYYIEPVSLATILERYQKGVQIGFENPAEFEYYDRLGRVNLYDLSFTQESNKSLENYFDTLPMIIFSLDDTKLDFIRCNKSFRDFVHQNVSQYNGIFSINYKDLKPGVGYYTFVTIRQCAIDGKQKIIDDRLKDGRNVQLFIKRIAVNPVTGASAVAIVILSVSELSDIELNYNYVARALSEDYIKLFFVNMDTEEFIEYSSNGENRDISFEKRGTHFFTYEKSGINLEIPDEELKHLKEEFTKEKVEEGIKKNGTFKLLTQITFKHKPVYTMIKAVKTQAEKSHVIVGISDVDDQIKAKEVLERAREEKIIYSRITALSGDYIYVYTVDLDSFHYKKYNPTGTISDLGIANEGDDFFGSIIKKAPLGIHSEDLHDFLTAFTRENVLHEIETRGMFENFHRLNINGTPIYVVMRATIVREEDEYKLIVGILNIDAQVKRQQEYEADLYNAQHRANYDELTGVKNKHAYASTEEKMDELIREGAMSDFAIAVFDINGLKQVNDTLGHQAGDEYIKSGCDIICHLFSHSPVYRIGGDEFVVVAQGSDYHNIDSIMLRLENQNLKNKLKGEVVVAGGMSRFLGDSDVASVFKRADAEMYDNKNELKKS